MTNWKDLKNWLDKNIIEYDGGMVKLRPEKKAIYSSLTSNALNRFMDSLEATLDNNDTCHLFPEYFSHRDFEDFFDLSECYFGKITNKKRIGFESYQDLKKIFLDWKKENKESKILETTSQENELTICRQPIIINNYTPIPIIKLYIEKVTDQPFNPKQMYLIYWNMRARMSREEIDTIVCREERIKAEEEEKRKNGIHADQKILNDTNDLEILEQQLDTLERALQGNQGEVECLKYRLKQVIKGGELNGTPEELKKEISEKKIKCEWWITKLQDQISIKKSKINLLRKNKTLKRENYDLRRHLLETKKTLLGLLKINIEEKLESDIQKTFLNILLDFQGQLVCLEDASPQSVLVPLSERQLVKAKEKLREKLNEKEINQICQLQIEITKLEIETEKIQEQLEEKTEAL